MSHILETDERGALTLSPEVLGSSRPYTRYTVEARADHLLLRPEGQRRDAPSREEWWKQWEALSDAVTDAWKTEQTAAELISEMRR